MSNEFVKMKIWLPCAVATMGTALSFQACARSQPAAQPGEPMVPASRPLSAAEHRERARAEEQRAKRERERFRNPVVGKPGALGPRHQERAREHEEHARQHEQAAAELERFEATECRSIPPPERASCPLLGPVVETTTIQGGTRITLDEGADMNRVLDHMRCHAAFAKSRAFQGMDECPLYHRGVAIEASPDGRGIDVTSSDPEVAAQIQHEAELHFGK